jgi:hypothetical protein
MARELSSYVGIMKKSEAVKLMRELDEACADDIINLEEIQQTE